MNRRIVLTAAVAGLLGSTAHASENGRTDTLRRFIDVVVMEGDTSALSGFVTPDVAIPGMDVEGIDAFKGASDAGHATRQQRYDASTFNVLSIAESDEWAHALVHFEGTTQTGQTEERYIFYVARFDGDLIAELYL